MQCVSMIRLEYNDWAEQFSFGKLLRSRDPAWSL